MEFYSDDKWRTQKDEQSSSSFMRSISQKHTSKTSLLRTLSLKGSNHKQGLSRSSSTKSSSSKPSLSRNSSKKCSEFAKKCGSLAKEQRAKFYIMKRCVKMLVFWRKDRDS